MYKKLLYLHRHLFTRLFIIDLLLVIIGEFYIFGRGENFLFVPNLIYIFTTFILFLSLNISQLRRFSGGALFYLNLPFSLNKTTLYFLLFRLITLMLLIAGITMPMSLLMGTELLRIQYSFHLLLFGGLISITSLPILLLLSKPHPEGVLLSLAYFLSFLPIWIFTTLCSEMFFKSHPAGAFFIPLIFLMMSIKIAQRVVRSVKL